MDFFLARLPVFKRLPPQALESLSQSLRLERYDRGMSIFEDGDAPESVYLLKTGLVKAIKYSPRDEPVTMEVIVPGSLFGMIAVLDKKPYPVSAACIQDSEAYRISAAHFGRLLKEHSDFSASVYSEIGGHLRHSQALRALAKEQADKRIGYILWLLSESVGKVLPIRRGEIAEMAGTTQETAIRVLQALKKNKLISSRWKSISVLRPERLKELSEPR